MAAGGGSVRPVSPRPRCSAGAVGPVACPEAAPLTAGHPPQAQETALTGHSSTCPGRERGSHERAGHRQWPGAWTGLRSREWTLSPGRAGGVAAHAAGAMLASAHMGLARPLLRGSPQRGSLHPSGFLQTCPAAAATVTVEGPVSRGAACALASGHAASQPLSNPARDAGRGRELRDTATHTGTSPV